MPRFLIRAGVAPQSAVGVLDAITGHPRHRFWSDDLAYSHEIVAGLVGHRRVTDAHLAALARRHQGRIATLDKGLAVLHDDVAELIAG